MSSKSSETGTDSDADAVSSGTGSLRKLRLQHGFPPRHLTLSLSATSGRGWSSARDARVRTISERHGQRPVASLSCCKLAAAQAPGVVGPCGCQLLRAPA